MTRPRNNKKKKKKRPELNSERLVSITKPILPGYEWVPKGNIYVTRHCRIRTLAAYQPLYVVHTHGQPNKTLGLRVPTQIAKQVLADAAATKKSRSSALESKDMRDLEIAREMLVKLYPNLPPEIAQEILNHGFAKYSGRVGRAGKLDLDERIHLAVQAHVRHKHTKYDMLLKTLDREIARRRVRAEMDALIDTWSGTRNIGSRNQVGTSSKRPDSLHSRFSKPEAPCAHRVVTTRVSRSASRASAATDRRLS